MSAPPFLLEGKCPLLESKQAEHTVALLQDPPKRVGLNQEAFMGTYSPGDRCSFCGRGSGQVSIDFSLFLFYIE